MMAGRSGFGLVELMVALVVLSVAVLGFGSATGRLSSGVARSAAQLAAINHVEDQINRILAEPDYDSLEARFGGVESGLEGIPSATRSTRFRHVREELATGRFLDYRRITVTVSSSVLRRPISRTITVAAP